MAGGQPDYFTLDEFRDLPDMGDAAKFPDSRVLGAASYITGIVERVVGTSFVGRPVVDEVHDGGETLVVLNELYALAVTSAKESDVAVTDTLTLRNGVVEKFSGAGVLMPLIWEVGRRNIKISYTAGYSTTPPGDIKEAVMQATRARLLSTMATSPIDDRRTSMSTDMGVVNFVVAGGDDHPTGYPEVDAVIVGWRDRIDVGGFA